jgi:hypothetical protein
MPRVIGQLVNEGLETPRDLNAAFAPGGQTPGDGSVSTQALAMFPEEAP